MKYRRRKRRKPVGHSCAHFCSSVFLLSGVLTVAKTSTERQSSATIFTQNTRMRRQEGILRLN